MTKSILRNLWIEIGSYKNVFFFQIFLLKYISNQIKFNKLNSSQVY